MIHTSEPSDFTAITWIRLRLKQPGKQTDKRGHMQTYAQTCRIFFFFIAILRKHTHWKKYEGIAPLIFFSSWTWIIVHLSLNIFAQVMCLKRYQFMYNSDIFVHCCCVLIDADIEHSLCSHFCIICCVH